MLKYIIAKKYNKYLKYYKICFKNCRKLKPKPKQYQTRHLSVFDCLQIYYLLIKVIPDSTFLVYTINKVDQTNVETYFFLIFKKFVQNI